jgi:hypothetical protein
MMAAATESYRATHDHARPHRSKDGSADPVGERGRCGRRQLRATLPAEGGHIAIEGPLPDGLENINEGLNRTGYAAKPNDPPTANLAASFVKNTAATKRSMRRSRRLLRDTAQSRPAYIHLPPTRHAIRTFNTLPAQAYRMSAPEQWGCSASDAVKIDLDEPRLSVRSRHGTRFEWLILNDPDLHCDRFRY